MGNMDIYSNPLAERYSSKEMLHIFSPQFKFRTWRQLWINLAEAEKELGLDFITDEQIEELKKYKDDVDFEVAAEFEKKLRHDVMAHVHTYGEQAKNARKIIHLGATSAYVGDNTDLIQIKEGLLIIRKKLLTLIKRMKEFSLEYKSLPTLGFTHFQAAQLTTVGKRATLWLHSLLLDFEELEFRLDNLRFRGVKGTTGTQASFKELFDGDFEKVKQLDKLVTEKAGFNKKQGVSGQTYDRKVDAQTLNLLSNIAQSAHKFTNDFRLLQHLKELEEPFEKNQIGSSAMAYKRNPMRSERISSLAKYVISSSQTGALVFATQWFERTLDDSANKRLSVPEAFLAIDGILDLYLNVVDGLVVYPKVIEKHLMAELPFMATENIMMDAVKAGGDRQELHERIRELSMIAGKNIKEFGEENNLLDLIAKDPMFNLSKEELKESMKPEKYIGRSSVQVEDFIKRNIKPILEENKELLGLKADINV